MQNPNMQYIADEIIKTQFTEGYDELSWNQYSSQIILTNKKNASWRVYILIATTLSWRK